MRIGCLQFAPQVGDVDNNLNRADAVLSRANPQDLDLLVLPELAFSGYNFKSLQHISPYLEPTTAGITSLWARTTALKYECVVTVGYPEKVDITPKWPASPEYYNSAITVNADGQTIANYRKSFLYYTDETWALEGPDGFFDGEIDGLGNVAMGICKWPTKSFERMDLNPYKFESPWNAWEFAYHILHKKANLVILSMAWLTREDARSYSRAPKEPDMETLSYWLARLEPVIRAETEGEIIVVLANRCGAEGEAVYAGTSAVLGIESGEVKVYGILGRGEKELLIVDTTLRPQAKLVSEPNSSASVSTSDQVPISSLGGDTRTNSTTSTVSDASVQTSSTGLSVNTQSTARSSTATPPTPDAMELTLGDIVTPVSPVDEKSFGLFFGGYMGHVPDPDSKRNSLKSTITQPQKQAEPDIINDDEIIDDDEIVAIIDESKDSIVFNRPESPKERNASRSASRSGHQPQHRATPFIDNDGVEIADAPAACARPPSPKSRNCSRTRKPEYQDPALISHDLAKEPQITGRTFGAKSPPHSASAVPDHLVLTFVDNGLGPRAKQVPPRPKSVLW